MPVSRPTRRLVAPLAAVAFLALWDSPVVFPLKIFVVFLHELSHGLAAIATGGSIQRIELSPYAGGFCVTRGGWPFAVTSAGYLGSLAWGAALLLLGARTRAGRLVLGFVGLVFLTTTALYVRSAFGIAYGVLAGGLLLFAAARLPPAGSEALTKILGVTSCLYAVWDIGSDTLSRNIAGSDANALARMTGVPGVLWGALWIAIAMVVTVWCFRHASR
jgi:uncharacterized membrane protein